ncbi:MAG: LCP family protein [Clostridia bacterium]|nr:LCP family protein [Clostridia bacterium]
MLKKINKKTVLIIDAVVLVLLIAAVLFSQLEKNDVADSQDDIDSFYARFIEYDGQVYPVKRGLQSVLLIGKDAMEGRRPDTDVETFYNDDLADFLLLMVFDHENKTVTPFQINRDTMCDVPWLSVNGLIGGYYPMQITMAHIFGSGKLDSSKNVVNAVTGLLHGAPVDHFFTFSMDTVPILNDLVGGVTVTLEDDIPTLGEKYVKGAKITLKGEEALRFVRTRAHDRVDANVARMGRQRLYMNAFLNQARTKIEKNPEFVVDAFDRIERFLITDLTVENVSEYVDDFYHYEVLPIVTPTGTYTLSEQSTAQFHPDEDSLWDCVHSTFCP